MRSVNGEPSSFCVGAVQVSVAEPVPTATTVIVNAGNDAVAVPSLTLIVMFVYVPTFAAVGVPSSRPVLVLNVAHAGRFAIENVSGLLFGSLAVGVNVYRLF